MSSPGSVGGGDFDVMAGESGALAAVQMGQGPWIALCPEVFF